MTSAVVDRPLVLRDGRQVRIRRAEPDDAAAILAYLGRVGGETLNLTFGAEDRIQRGGGAGLPRPIWRQRTTRSRSWRLRKTRSSVAHVRRRRRPRMRHAGEFGISVLQAYAGVGLGKALLEYLLAWAERGGLCGRSTSKCGWITFRRSASTSGWVGCAKGALAGYPHRRAVQRLSADGPEGGLRLKAGVTKKLDGLESADTETGRTTIFARRAARSALPAAGFPEVPRECAAALEGFFSDP